MSWSWGPGLDKSKYNLESSVIPKSLFDPVFLTLFNEQDNFSNFVKYLKQLFKIPFSNEIFNFFNLFKL